MNCRVRVISLEDYDRIRQAEPLLQAGRMRSCSPGRQPSVKAERKPYHIKPNHRNDSRGRSPARYNAGMVDNARILVSSTSGQIGRRTQAASVEPGELAEDDKKKDALLYASDVAPTGSL